ncbi:MAG: DNA/RNA-binding protein AlbA [Caldisphaeraceae archaeon]|nr:DNA/RNA-binding protein AlbA [Caldisphaeraceae archaeon]
MPEEGKEEISTIFIGKKPLMSYALVAIGLFNHEDAKRIRIKARGRNICKAVDMVEYLRNIYSKDIVVQDLTIGEDEVKDEDGNPKKVPSIEIVIERGENTPII